MRVIVINYDGLNMVYQEFANSTGNSRVKVGDQVKVGQVIGIRDTAHLHLGFTRMDWRQAQDMHSLMMVHGSIRYHFE